MNILGISAFYHDSAAAAVQDGLVTAAAQEERFTRKKNFEGFPVEAVTFCLRQTGLSLNEMDAIVFYDKPLLKFERLLETYYVNAPKGLRQFMSFAPVWIKEKLFLKKIIRDRLKEIDPNFNAGKGRLFFPEHHLSHAASAFYPSPFEDSAIVTMDGVGEWATATIMHGRGCRIDPLRELRFPHSIGLLYSAFTYFLGFKVNSGEYKVMGMAPYGDPTSPNIEMYKEKILRELVELRNDGSIFLNQDYFDYATGLRMVDDDKWESLFGFRRRPLESQVEQHHCDLAMAIQHIHDEIAIRLAKEAKRLTGAKNLCLAGGSALNCVSNGKVLKAGIFDHIWIQPAAGDAGGALGAALAVYHMYFGKERIVDNQEDTMRGAYLGPEYSDIDGELMARKYKAAYKKYDDFGDLCDFVADQIANGKVIGWHQGRMEWGPRALGNRSIIGDPRNKDMQKKLNLKIKYREGFRPFAPSVLSEDAKEFFELDCSSPYMLLVGDVRKKRQLQLPEGFHKMPLLEKLYYPRSDVQAVTHLDFSARIQTVHKHTNPRFWQLIDTFKKKTGYGIIVNTSFNVRGEPIVCTPEDSFKCFMGTEMDILVIGNLVFVKEQQPEWDNKDKWKRNFKLD